jgi:hypothetical protein
VSRDAAVFYTLLETAKLAGAPITMAGRIIALGEAQLLLPNRQHNALSHFLGSSNRRVTAATLFPGHAGISELVREVLRIRAGT